MNDYANTQSPKIISKYIHFKLVVSHINFQQGGKISFKSANTKDLDKPKKKNNIMQNPFKDQSNKKSKVRDKGYKGKFLYEKIELIKRIINA